MCTLCLCILRSILHKNVTFFRARESNDTGAPKVVFPSERAIALSLDDLQGVFYLGALALGVTLIVFGLELTCGKAILHSGTFAY